MVARDGVMGVQAMRVVGIDPGLSGAIACVSDDTVIVWDTPTFEVVKGKKKRRQINATMFASILAEASPDHVVIEQVNAMPGQGVSSMFNFGRSLGVAEGVVGAMRIPLTMVTPQKWKKALSLSQDKGESRRRASLLFPGNAEDFSRVKDDGRAEAALMAYWHLSAAKEA